jgi:glutamate synthase domain-containing protein 1
VQRVDCRDERRDAVKQVARLRRAAGFVVDIKGVRTHTVVEQALDAIKHLDHRGAAAADALSGDGVGLTTQVPSHFFRKNFHFSTR